MEASISPLFSLMSVISRILSLQRKTPCFKSILDFLFHLPRNNPPYRAFLTHDSIQQDIRIKFIKIKAFAGKYVNEHIILFRKSMQAYMAFSKHNKARNTLNCCAWIKPFHNMRQ